MGADSTPKVTVDGHGLIRALQSARQRVKEATRELSSAECAAGNAENAIVKWLVPTDASTGDVFCVPIGRTFPEVRVTERKLYGGPTGGEFKQPAYVIGWRSGVEPRREEL